MSITVESSAATARVNDLPPPKSVFVGPPSPPPQQPVVIASSADKEVFGEDIKKQIEDYVAPRTQVPEDYVPSVKSVDEIFKEDTHCSDNYASIIGDDEVVDVEGFKGELVRIDNWDDAGLPESLLNNIKRAQYLKPREIQKAVIPLILDSYDVIGHAETGSGKTAAYMIPIIAECIAAKNEQKYRPDRGYPYALIIAPTRELVRQCTEQSMKLADGTGVQVAKAYGEYPTRKNIDEIYNGCDILIATPGRFKHFVERDIIRFAKLRFLVFDEGDHLLTQNFADDVRPILHLPSFPKGNARQTLFFSATFTNAMLLNAKEFMREDAHVLVSNHKNAVNKRCVQEFVAPEPYKKFAVLVDFLKGELAKVDNDVKKFPRTMVFCNTREYCEKLTIALSYSGIITKPLNSMRAQDLREQAFDEFRANEISVLIVTDVLARGIDIKELDLVINFDMPYDFETYIHRVGRTGRVREGRAISYVDRSPRRLQLLEQIKQSCEQAGHIVPKSLEDILAGQAPPSSDDNPTTTTASISEESLPEDMKKMDIAADQSQLESIKEEEE